MKTIKQTLIALIKTYFLLIFLILAGIFIAEVFIPFSAKLLLILFNI